MSLMTRYILKEFLSVFFVTAMALAVVELAVDFLEKFRLLYQYGPEMEWLVKYFSFRLLRVFFETLPLALLLTTLITFGGLAKNNEITAFKSAGISIFSLVVPLFFFGAVISFVSYELSGTLIPTLAKRAKVIRAVHIEKRTPSSAFIQNKIWLHLDSRRLMHVQVVSADRMRMKGVHLYVLGDDFRIVEEAEAAELVYEMGKWTLLEGTHRRFLADSQIQFKIFEQMEIKSSKAPEDFQDATFELREMTYDDLRSYIVQLSATGFKATRYEVDLHGKQAMPFMNFMMILLAVPFALKGNRSSGIARGIALSLAIALSYWVVFSLGLSLGRLGIFTPWLAGWSANILIFSISIYLFLNMRQ